MDVNGSFSEIGETTSLHPQDFVKFFTFTIIDIDKVHTVLSSQ